MRTLKRALLLLTCPGLWLGAMAQTPPVPPLEIRQDSALINYGSYRGVPLSPTVGTPPGSDGRAPTLPSAGQFQTFVSFGSAAIPATPLDLDPNKTLSANAANIQLPRYPAQGTPSVVLLRARVGAPFLSQQISFLFGSVVPTPDTDEAGTALPANQRATYWQTEPYTTNAHANTGYYWSPHARSVFAVQAGPLDITWKKTTPLTSLPGDYTPQKYSLEGGNYYPLYKVRYYVSGSAAKTPRKMYWTQGSFRSTGFPVSIPSTRVGVLNIVYNKNFPERVAHEYEALGDSQIVETNRLEETRTMWYDSQQGFVYAYNQEGRAFIELLGDANSDGRTRKHLGYEIVDVVRQPLPADIRIELGEKIKAYEDGRDESTLVASPIAPPVGVSFAYRYTAPGAENSTYYANRETRNLNDYQVHWLEPGLQGVLWPTRLARYQFAWPTDVAKYSHYVRPRVSSEQEAKLTAVPVPSQNIAFIDYQDPLDRPRANLTEKFEFYTFLEPAYPAHRTLVRLMSGEDVAFERVFSWLDQNLRSTNFSGTVVTNLVAWSTNSNTFSWPNEMTVPRVVSSTVEVGQRISAPAGEAGATATEPYLAGYIRQTEGTSFDVNAYVDPFAQGFEAANKGAIIPVNAIPGKNTLEVWWYRKNHTDSTRGFKPLYWPSVISRYTIEWPANPREIVLASNDGSGGLESLLAKGSIYFQNDNRLPGYNPNEEHALMQGGQAFALRDDLNVTTNDSSYTSEPYVLLEYTGADNRPAMLPFKVLREKRQAGISFDYAVNAGTILQPPMPLPLMEKPSIKVKGKPPMSLNKEIVTWSIANSSTAGGVLSFPSATFLPDANYTGLEVGTSQQNYFAPDTLLVLQDTAQASLPTVWFYATNTATAARKLQGYVSTREPFEVSNPTNGPGAYAFSGRYTTALTNQVAENDFVLMIDEKAGANWLGQVLGIINQTTNKVIAVGFQDTGVPNHTASAELGANKLMVLTTPGNYKNWRVSAEKLPPNVADQAMRDRFSEFTMQDRKGNVWVYRGPHNESDKGFMIMRFYYKTLPGFYFPSLAFDKQPEVGTITPYLRALDENGAYVGDPVEGNLDEDDKGDANALGITYRPAWPQFAPVLNMAESLTLPKRGLPAVRGQTSLEVFYQQSQAQGSGNLTNKSVELHDPTREKTFALADAGDATSLDKIPDSIKTQGYSGRTYFPNLPPHLAERFFLDPNRSKNGTLVFKGQFVDAPLGDDYLLLNVLSGQDAKAIMGLCLTDDPRKAKWDAAITNGLTTVMEFFAEDEGKPGTYIPYSGTDKGPSELAAVDNDDVAVDSYALSAVGPGVGYVTLLAGNGLAFTKPDEPVSIQIIKVVKTLYRGEVKVVEGSNPLSEKLTLQQVTDLAGLTQDYGFEWKIASPVDGLPPAVYQTTTRSVLGDELWHHLPYPLGTDKPAVVGSTPANRLESDTYLSVVPLSLIPFESVTTNGSKLEFTLAAGQTHSLATGNVLTMRDAANRQMLGTVTSTSDNLIGVTVNSGQTILGDNFQVETLEERAIADEPQSVLFRDVEITNLENFVSVWLSLDLGTGMKARVYLDNQLVVTSGFGDEDTATATPPPAVTRLAQNYRLGPEVFAQMKASTVRLVVELFSTTQPGSSRTFRLRLDVDEHNDLTNLAGSQWLPLDAVRYEDGVRAILGGTADVRSLADNYLIMRYYPTNATHTSYGTKSQWTEPQLAEGWIKRVLKGINPFNQRVSDLANNQVNTDVSLLTQAGQRWEGDVALNLDNINNFGLIEIYETVLRRGRMLSIDAGINYGPANDALLLAAGYLNDLYMMVGNEASADAANPTIGIGTKDQTYGDIATALFAFKGQVPTLLEEELALLRGRDDFLQPGVETSPIYNRLVWNYTRGIDSGEVIYALNYNIQENPANGANGVINADDARIMYPQGHGDAYGHYLTALKGYYSLMLDTDFDWVPRTEAVTVLGKPVQVDYLDERKFATAASAVARTGRQIFDLTWRHDYQATKTEAWKAFGGTRTNDRRTLPTTRCWGLDHWAARTGQGAFLNWVAGNAILPAVDPDPSHEGIQKIDRTTVPELQELPTVVADLQASMDNAEAGLTPLGLSTGAIAFDVNPQSIVAADPKTHFEQVFDRAKGALRNAVAAFDDSKDVTRLMRSENDSLADFRASVARQELAYTNALIELFGTPYPDDVGPGRLYKTGYEGPDLFHYVYVENPELVLGGVLNPTESQTFRIDVQDFPESWRHGAETSFPDSIKPISEDPAKYVKNVHYVEYELAPHGFFDKPATWTGKRKSPGKIQQAISDIIKGRNELARIMDDAEGTKQDLDAFLVLFAQKVETHSVTLAMENAKFSLELINSSLAFANDIYEAVQDETKDTITRTTDVVKETLPTSLVVGLANGGDLSAPARAALKSTGYAVTEVLDAVQVARKIVVLSMQYINDSIAAGLDVGIAAADWDQELREAVMELRDLQNSIADRYFTINQRLQEYDDAQRRLKQLVAEGDRILQERELFRQRSAAVIQGYRTRDAAFRIFRNEKLERYKSLFDLAAKYSFLAAQAYDYETGLLHTDAGHGFLARVINSRALGMMKDGEPQYAGSNTGDPGLSSALAEMFADWQTLKGRLGFNNSDGYATTVSLRSENFRILPGADSDLNWRDVLEKGRRANLLDDSDVRRNCMQISRGEGLPVPGIIIEFSTTIADGLNLFGKSLAAGDHNFSPSSFATKIFSVGVAMEGYLGMDDPGANSSSVTFAGGSSPADPTITFLDTKALAATPYVYLIPVGVDSMRSPPLGDASTIRTWSVDDVTIPLPFNIGASDFSTKKLYQSADSLSEELFSTRKHQAFRPVSSVATFAQLNYAPLKPSPFTNSRLIGRSVWNSGWKLVIPGHTLLSNPNEGLDRFTQSVKDIKLRFTTYSYSGN